MESYGLLFSTTYRSSNSLCYNSMMDDWFVFSVCLFPEPSNVLVIRILYARVARSADSMELFAGVFVLLQR